MDLHLCCEKCGQKLVVDKAGVGMLVPCPNCGHQLSIPRFTFRDWLNLRSKSFWLVFSVLTCAMTFWLTGKIFFDHLSPHEIELSNRYNEIRTRNEAAIESNKKFHAVADSAMKDQSVFNDQYRSASKLSDATYKSDFEYYDEISKAANDFFDATKPRLKLLSDFYLAAFFLVGVSAGLYAWFYFRLRAC